MAGQTLNLGLAAGISLLVVGAVVAGLWLVGGPETERGRRLDAQRVADLNQIAIALDCHWTVHGRLPDSLRHLRDQTRDTQEAAPTRWGYRCHVETIADPESGKDYDYAPTDGRYRLCGVFAGQAEAGAVRQRERFPKAHRAAWNHGAGRHCLTLTPRRLEEPSK